MQADKKLVERLAHLAKLEFREEEKDELLKDFNNILTFVEKLSELDTHGVEPLDYITAERNVLRADELKPELTLKKEEGLRNAPQKDSDYFKVPKVLKKQ